MRETDVVNFTALINNERHVAHKEAAEYCFESEKTPENRRHRIDSIQSLYISDENYIASKIKFVEELANEL